MKISAGQKRGSHSYYLLTFLRFPGSIQRSRLAGGTDARARVLRRDVVFCAKHAYYHAFGFVWPKNVVICMFGTEKPENHGNMHVCGPNRSKSVVICMFCSFALSGIWERKT